MKKLCPYCDDIKDLSLVQGKEAVSVRGESIEVDSHYLKCNTCNNTFDDPKDNFDVLDVAYREYRRRHDLLQPEQIKAWRKQHGLTQIELSKLLGFGNVTITRYEGGKLQETSHDRAIKLAMKTENLLSLIKENSEAISEQDKRNRIINTLELELDEEHSFKSICESKFGRYAPGEFSGFKKLDINKTFSAILFFCKGSGVFKTKLNKLLFYADFKAFKEHSLSITGLQYAKMPYGPVPDKYEFYIATLKDNNDIISEEISYDNGAVGEKIIASQEPDLSIFNDDEIEVLIHVKKRFQDTNAKEISNISHRERAYNETQDFKFISYIFATDLGM